MTYFLIGIIVGLLVGVFIGSGVAGDEIINKIGKIKGNGGAVTVDQEQEEKPKKKGLFRRIFNKKKKQ